MRRWLAGLAVFMMASSLRAQAVVTGYVRNDESLRGLQGVEVSVDGSDKKVRTDKEGKFTLKDFSPGDVRLHIRSVGFGPIDTSLTVAAGKPTETVFFLVTRAIALDTVTTRSGRAAASGFESFDLRRAKGFGKFLDSAQLKQNENRQVGDLVGDFGFLNVVVPSTCHGEYTTWCNWRVAASRHAEAPDISGGDDAGCGVVVLWTRR